MSFVAVKSIPPIFAHTLALVALPAGVHTYVMSVTEEVSHALRSPSNAEA